MTVSSATVDRLVDATAGRVAGPAFGLGSLVRRARVFHPRGRSFSARIRCVGDPRFAATVFGRPGVHEGTVRLSRGAGLPEPLPDLLGLALRLDLAEGPQDLLLVSSAPAPVARHALLPTRDYGAAHYSSITTFGVGTTTVVLGAVPVHTGPRGSLERLQAVSEAVDAGRLGLTLLAAEPTGPWSAVGDVELLGPVPDAEGERVRYTPFHEAGGIEPTGPVNALRRRAYADSQQARPS